MEKIHENMHENTNVFLYLVPTFPPPRLKVVVILIASFPGPCRFRYFKVVNVIAVARGCNQSVSLESDSYSDDQFCESVGCTRETERSLSAL